MNSSPSDSSSSTGGVKQRSNCYLLEFINLLRKITKLNILAHLVIKKNLKASYQKYQMHIFILTEMNVKCSPLLRTGMEITSFYMQVSGTNGLGSKSIKQSHLGS